MKKISDKLIGGLNRQITAEFESAYLSNIKTPDKSTGVFTLFRCLKHQIPYSSRTYGWERRNKDSSSFPAQPAPRLYNLDVPRSGKG